MSKMRVYEIAKELKTESKVLVTKLQELGYVVKSHASSLEDGVAKEIIEKLQKEHQASIVEKRISTGVIRRRAKKSPAPAPAAAVETDLEEIVEVKAAPEPEKTPAEQAREEPAAGEAQPGEAQPAGKEAVTAEPQELVEERKEAGREKQAPRKRAGPKSDFYTAKVIKRADPVDLAERKTTAAPPKTGDAKPTGIRVLKVVPGKEGRGHQFIDMSKRDKGRRKTTASSRKGKTNLRDQLFDSFSPAYLPGRSRRRRMTRKTGKKTALTTPKALKRVIRVESDSVVTSEFARRMGVKLTEVNRKLREMGEEIDNLRMDGELNLETASMLAQEFDYEVQDATFKEENILRPTGGDTVEDLAGRPPVVTVMGHVDHGKTSILDAIRKTKVTDGEEGGITQHIGAYEVSLPEGSITFIDTPGHEAFTAMRARGAGITDIVVLVVAADDGIMPQTIEAIHHAQEAEVPIIVAINKIDLPGVQTEKIRQQLTEHKLVPEAWGGETIIVEVSAKTKVGLDELLESILLQAEVLELKANPNKPAQGTVIEARLDRGRGPVATLLVSQGTLERGEVVVMGTAFGKTRMMFDYEGSDMQAATPGRPVQVQGLNEVPAAGEPFNVVASEREAKKLVGHRLEEKRAARSGQTARLNLEDFYEKLQGVEKLELKVIVKADVQGTAEAVKQALEKLSVDKVGVTVIHHGVGAINETDVNLAAASEAVLVGFNVRPDSNAKKLAQTEQLEIRVYKVIYDLTQDIRKAQTGLLPATTKEQTIGRAEVRELFTVPKIGTVAGVSVVDGKMQRGSMLRLLRDSVEVHQGRMSSLRRFKEDVREVASGYECGIGIENYNDIKRGDVIESFIIEQEQPAL